MTTEKEKYSYALGMDIGGKLKEQGYDLDPDSMAMGLAAALKGGETLLTKEESVELIAALRQKLVRQEIERQEKLAEENSEKGRKFLEENKTQKGVQVTGSGLQYKVLKEGEGTPPKATDTVTVHYKGTLIDGTVFDSSYERGEPASFPLQGVIPGWTEGLQLMKPGAKYIFYVPDTLAYGRRQAGRLISPNSTLIFEVELLKVGE